MDLFTPSMPDRGIATLWLLLGISAGVILFLFDPAVNRLYPACPFRSLTGLLCPGCGSTRALHQLLHGEIIAAIRLSPMLLVVSPILGYATISTFAFVFRGRPLPQMKIGRGAIWGLLVVTIGFWLLRNMAWWSSSPGG